MSFRYYIRPDPPNQLDYFHGRFSCPCYICQREDEEIENGLSAILFTTDLFLFRDRQSATKHASFLLHHSSATLNALCVYVVLFPICPPPPSIHPNNNSRVIHFLCFSFSSHSPRIILPAPGQGGNTGVQVSGRVSAARVRVRAERWSRSSGTV